jgi:hypothetical protein
MKICVLSAQTGLTIIHEYPSRCVEEEYFPTKVGVPTMGKEEKQLRSVYAIFMRACK